MKAKADLLNCASLKMHKYSWAYYMLRHIQELDEAFSLADTHDDITESRFRGSAITASALLNLVESIHGPDECIVRGEECIVSWMREYLDLCDIPNLNDREREN